MTASLMDIGNSFGDPASPLINRSRNSSVEDDDDVVFIESIQPPSTSAPVIGVQRNFTFASSRNEKLQGNYSIILPSSRDLASQKGSLSETIVIDDEEDMETNGREKRNSSSFIEWGLPRAKNRTKDLDFSTSSLSRSKTKTAVGPFNPGRVNVAGDEFQNGEFATHHSPGKHNQCFNKYRLANGLIMNCCEQCGEYLPSKDVGNNVLVIEGQQMRFCCQSCINEYKQESRTLAEIAKAELDGTILKSRPLRIRFATHGAALTVKNLSPVVSNELLEQAFSQFGPVEKAVVVVDDRGRATGKGFVEFAAKPPARKALERCGDGAFLLTTTPRPVIVEPMEQFDDEDGLPEKLMQKTQQYHKEREQPPRFAQPGTFEFEYASRWKALDEMEKQQREQVDRNIREAKEKLEAEMEAARHEHQLMLMRQESPITCTKANFPDQSPNIWHEEEHRRREEEMIRHREQEELRRQQEGFKPNYMENVVNEN
ncbi:hypothetical protein CB1_000273063 [Camelus ferus]|nr:hypothetical protein CB1_000273063 [Camelus ferus]